MPRRVRNRVRRWRWPLPALNLRPWITILPIIRSRPPAARRGAVPNRTCRRQDLPPQDLALASGDIDPATASAAEEDEEARLPEVAGGTRRGGRRRDARGRPCRDRKCGAAGADLARRLSHAQCGERRALCRQGEKRPQAALLLCPCQRAPARAHPAHDRGHRGGRDRLDHDRDRGTAARSQSDQAAAAALQRATARRQVVSLYPDHRRSLGAADPQASRRADRGPGDISGRSPRPARSIAPSRRCSAPS